MKTQIIAKQKDKYDNTRYFILPIETREGFLDLIEFINQEFTCHFSELDEGPGTIVKRGTVEGTGIVFVLSDMTGVQFYSETNDKVTTDRIALRIENRIRELQS
jgi:hypothetical protein